MDNQEYEELSAEFAQLNLEVNAARENGTLTDEQELAFYRAEKQIQDANRQVNTPETDEETEEDE